MNTPALLLGVTLLFWGWETGYHLMGILIAVAVEGSRWVKARWELSDEDFNRTWNLCAVLFMGGAVVAFTTNDGSGAVTGFLSANSFSARSQSLNKAAQAALIFFQWLPFIFLPFVLAQAYSGREKVDVATFSWFLRRKRVREKRPANERTLMVNVGYPYFGVCIVAASAANVQNAGFYIGMCVLLAWAIWRQRSPRFSIAPLSSATGGQEPCSAFRCRANRE